MDYVRSVPLDQYVRNEKLTLEDALKLFSRVCEAVNYAHRKGVIRVVFVALLLYCGTKMFMMGWAQASG